MKMTINKFMASQKLEIELLDQFPIIVCDTASDAAFEAIKFLSKEWADQCANGSNLSECLESDIPQMVHYITQWVEAVRTNIVLQNTKSKL